MHYSHTQRQTHTHAEVYMSCRWVSIHPDKFGTPTTDLMSVDVDVFEACGQWPHGTVSYTYAKYTNTSYTHRILRGGTQQQSRPTNPTASVNKNLSIFSFWCCKCLIAQFSTAALDSELVECSSEAAGVHCFYDLLPFRILAVVGFQLKTGYYSHV